MRSTTQAPTRQPTQTGHSTPAIGMPFDWHPLPLVIETDGDSAWAAWDCAVRELDARTPDGRAAALAVA